MKTVEELALEFAITIQTKEGTISRLNAIEWFKAGYNKAASENERILLAQRKIVQFIKNEMCHKSIDEIKESDAIDFLKNEAEFKEMCAKDCKRMEVENNHAWCDLSLYLDTEHDEGKTEFRLVVNADKSFYIHPLGKDGKTLDGKL